jgi:ATP-dependent DNA helicase RecG
VGEFARVQQLSQPDYVLLPDDGDEAEDAEAISAFARPLIPVYPASAKVSSWSLSKAIDVVLDGLEISDADDPIPEHVRRAHGLMSLPEALVAIHRPEAHADVARARARLKWDEALVLQVVLAQRRSAARALPAIARAQSSGGLLERFDANLPFELTDGQKDVGDEIAADLALDHPMHRLLQGEVGSGKTICAVRAMLAVIDAGGQAALLAPTEVLAAQHARSISAMLGPMAQGGRLGGDVEGTRVALITGSQSTKARRTAMLDAVSGDAPVPPGARSVRGPLNA